jgi:hypothetical protein
MDTSVVVSADPPALGDDDLFVTAITFAELHAAVLGASNEDDRARRLRRLTTLAALYDPLPLDATVAIAYGRIAATIGQSQGTHPSQIMARLIAATALANGCRLYTRRPGEFRGLESVLEVIGV